jgi:hypothetical protein
MKNLVYLFSIALCLSAVTGCSDWGEEPDLNILELESANVSFDAYGGSGEIVAKTTAGVTASSAATWCTTAISGNKITVTVPPYGELLGRSTVVTVISGGKNVPVPVTQSGLELKIESRTVELPDVESDTTLQITCPIPVTVQSSATWLVADVTAGNVLRLHAEANGSLAQRTATVTLTAAPIEVTVTVIQKVPVLAFNDYIGTWTFTHTTAAATTGTKYNKTALVTNYGNNILAVTLKNGTLTTSTDMFGFAMLYDAATGTVNIPSQKIGETTANDIYLAAWEVSGTGSLFVDSGGLISSTTGGTVANPVLAFSDDGTASAVIRGFVLWQVNKSTGANGEYTGFGGSPTASRSRYTNITMTKQ